jgi:putative oxidoreductase
MSGLMFTCHGTQKLLGWPPSSHPVGPLPPILIAAGWIELVGGLMIAIGFFTGIVALIASGEMAVAYFVAHASKGGPIPMVNGGEMAALYCFVFLYVAAHGSGIWSIDAAMRGRTRLATPTTS